MTKKLSKPFNDIVSTDLTDMTQKEHDAYLEYVKEKNNGSLDGISDITVTAADDDNVEISYCIDEEKFERIRRINVSVESLLCGNAESNIY